MKYKITLEYDGTKFSGWQYQKNARSVQGILYEVAYEIFDTEEVDIQGAGRTDKGVHALNQVAHLQAPGNIPEDVLKIKFNDLLPPEINILSVSRVNDKFHARHDAIARSYIYQISTRRTAFGKKYVWWVKDALDVKKMGACLSLLPGMHDFRSFSEANDSEKNTLVNLELAQIFQNDSLIIIRLKASHFLWKMVRRITGVLVEVGRGNFNENNILTFLTEYSAEPAKYTAPPSGLFLEKIYYHKSDELPVLRPMINIFN